MLKTNSFADIVNRKNRATEDREVESAREKYVKELFRAEAHKFIPELIEIFGEGRVEACRYTSFVKANSYVVAEHREYKSPVRDYLVIHHAITNPYSADIKIPFEYSWNDSKLIALIREAVRALVSRAYSPSFINEQKKRA